MRPQFTAYERDSETSLDYAEARCYSSTQGRFTSIDPLVASASTANPQTFNRYSYVRNSPLTQIDPSGMTGIAPGPENPFRPGFCQQSTDKPKQSTTQQPKPVATDEITIGGVKIKVEQTDEPAAFDRKKINGILRTGVGVQLVFTFTQNGKPLKGATVTESVQALKGDPITQNKQPVPLDENGRALDYVTNSAPTPQSRSEAQNLYNQVNEPFVTEQKATFTLTLKNGTKIEVKQVRGLTNLTSGGTLQQVDPQLGTPAYTFNMQHLSGRVVKR